MHPYERLSLDTVGYIVAIWLMSLHLWMLIKPTESKRFLIKLPRNRVIAPWLMGAGMFWFWLLIAPSGLGPLSKLQMDLGEFNQAKSLLRIIIPIAAVGMITQVKEFLAVRGLGLVALMAAAPLLYGAYLEPPISRLLIPIYAYAMIFGGLFWDGMPFTLRDLITYVTKTEARYRASAIAGFSYGVAVLICAILWW